MTDRPASARDGLTGDVDAWPLDCAAPFLDRAASNANVIAGPWPLVAERMPGRSGRDNAGAFNETFAFRPGDISAGTKITDAAPVRPDERLRFPRSAPRSRSFAITCLGIALALHCAPVIALLDRTPPLSVGAGGIELEAINVEFIDAAVLQAQKETLDQAGGQDRAVAATQGSNAEAVPVTASPAAKTKIDEIAPVPPPNEQVPVQAPQRPAQNVLVTTQSDWEVDQIPSRKPLDPEPVQRPIEPITEAPPTPDLKDREKKPEPTPAPAAQQAVAASVQGGATTASRQTAQSAAVAGRAAASQGEVNRFVAGIRAALAKAKPVGKKRLGTAMVAFAISSDGSLSYVRIEKSSGNPGLDDAATDAVRRAAPFRTPPTGMAPEALTFVVPYRFE